MRLGAPVPKEFTIDQQALTITKPREKEKEFTIEEAITEISIKTNIGGFPNDPTTGDPLQKLKDKEIRSFSSSLAHTEASNSISSTQNDAELLKLDVVSYEDFARGDPQALAQLKKALNEQGIVGIRSVPGYKESVQDFIEKAREFSTLPLEIKQKYSPNRDAKEFLGYEIGKEKFQRPDGTWAIDQAKASYYAIVSSDSPVNKWPVECDLKTSFQIVGSLMFDTAKTVLEKIQLIAPDCGVSLDDINGIGRMLHYIVDPMNDNPLWCGAHFDHSLFTALLPAFYFENGRLIPEPKEAGLFVKTTNDREFKKVVTDDPDVMLFQVGEFGQLATNDGIRATEHEVLKASGNIERYTMAVFIGPSMESTIYSNSVLAADSRYGAQPGEACKFQQWHEASLNRYEVK
jgi:isopenicillin N synthase-like dioxygenase